MNTLKAGYKETEIGVLPVEWGVARVGEILNVQTGSMNAQDQVENGKYPFFTRSINVQTIDTYAYDAEALFIAGEGNFKVKYYKGKFNLHQRTYMLTSMDDSNMKFMLNAIQPKVNKLISTSVGSTVQSLRKPIIEDLKIPLPPLKEQEKIAAILSTADEKIEAIAEQIQKHETLKKGLLQKLLREGIGHTEFKESELGSLPVGWEIVKLKEILTVKYGKSQKDVEDENGEYPILGTGGLMGYANSFLCDKPSVLIGRKGTIDKPQYKDTPFWTVDTLFYTDIKENVALAKYVYFKFLTIQWRTLNEASGVPSLSAPNIHAVKMQLPPLEEQKQIADILSTADEKLEVLSAKKEKFETLKKGLLQKLLSGEVRV